MIRGLYTAYTGMVNEQKRLDVISNNLANAATVGFKKESVANQAFDKELTIRIKDASSLYQNMPIGKMSLGVKIGENYTDYTQGSVRATGNTYDLALSGNGFFAMSVTDKNGNETEKYSRDGAFKRTQDGYIVDAYGNHLKGESGNIQIPEDAANVVIDKDGTIYADEVRVDKIKLVDFNDYNYIKKYADNLYDIADGTEALEADGMVLQGYTEQSNVNSVREMVDMITVTRVYEANQKVIQTVDTMLEKTVNQVGKM